jgi:hypothetical protein
LSKVLYLLALQGILGALDTLYYHEWRARLPLLGPIAGVELKLHAARDFLYMIIFSTLPWLAWRGFWTSALASLLLAEIFITFKDFIVEDEVRKPLGGVYHGERVMHGVMGIVYGAMLAFLIPVMVSWWSAPTALAFSPPPFPRALRWTLMLMSLGLFLSGARDAGAAYGLPHSSWPWGHRGRAGLESKLEAKTS